MEQGVGLWLGGDQVRGSLISVFCGDVMSDRPALEENEAIVLLLCDDVIAKIGGKLIR